MLIVLNPPYCSQKLSRHREDQWMGVPSSGCCWKEGREASLCSCFIKIGWILSKRSGQPQQDHLHCSVVSREILPRVLGLLQHFCSLLLSAECEIIRMCWLGLRMSHGKGTSLNLTHMLTVTFTNLANYYMKKKKRMSMCMCVISARRDWWA